MQYVNSGVLQLTGDFMAQVLKGRSDLLPLSCLKNYVLHSSLIFIPFTCSIPVTCIISMYLHEE